MSTGASRSSEPSDTLAGSRHPPEESSGRALSRVWLLDTLAPAIVTSNPATPTQLASSCGGSTVTEAEGLSAQLAMRGASPTR